MGADAATRLWVEIAESEIPSGAAAVVEELTARGVTVAIDDFGSAYSNLHRLGTLDVGVLKLDAGLVAAAGESPRTFELVAGLVAAARRNGSVVVAAGIETQELMATAARMGCSHGQGWYFGRPAPSMLVAERFTDSTPMTQLDWPSQSEIRAFEAGLVAEAVDGAQPDVRLS